MQMVWGFISPPICAVFVVGMVSQRVPAMAASVGLAVGPFLYGLQLWLLSPELGGSGTMSYINVMALTALEVAAIMVVIGVARPRDGATTFPDTKEVDMTASRSANVVGVAIVAMTVALYCYFF
jgi:SSS family solute:Na+ symporter